MVPVRGAASFTTERHRTVWRGTDQAHSVTTMEITLGPPPAAPAPRARRVPWSPRVWGQVLYLAAGIPVQVLGGLVIVGVVAAATASPPNALRVILAWFLGAVALLLLTPVLTRVHRHRLRATAGVDISPQPKRRLLSPHGVEAMLRSQSTWRQLTYHVLAGPALAVAAAAAVFLWPASVLLVFLFVFTWSNGHPEVRGRHCPATRPVTRPT